MNRFARECGEFSQCWKRWLHLHLHWFSILSVVIFQLVCQAKLFSKHSQDICKPSCYRWPLGLRTFHVCVCSARLEREMLWRWNTFEQIFFECVDTRSQRKSFWPNKYERLIKQIWKIDQTNMNATADRERSSRFILQSQVASLEAGSIKPEQVIKEALSSLDFQEKTNFSSFNFSLPGFPHSLSCPGLPVRLPPASRSGGKSAALHRQPQLLAWPDPPGT